MAQPRYDDPELSLSELMSHWPETVSVFASHGMLCIGCMVGPFHTVGDACNEYGLSMNSFLAELDESIKATTRTRQPVGADRKL